MTLSGADVLSKCHLLHGPIWWLKLWVSCLHFNKEERKAGNIYGMKAEGRTIQGGWRNQQERETGLARWLKCPWLDSILE